MARVVYGARELMAELDKLETKVRNKVLREALKAGGDVVLEEARRLVPKREARPKPKKARPQIKFGRDQKRLLKAMGIKTTQKSGREMVLSKSLRKTVWVRKGFGRGRVSATAPHAHLVEYGTKMRKTKKGKSTGAAQPRPFMRLAFDRKSDEARAVMTRVIQRGVMGA